MSGFLTGVLQVCMSFVGSLGFSILYNVRGRRVLLAALGGAVSWGLYLLLGLALESVTTRYFLCAVFVAFYAEILARVLKTPAATFLIPSMIPHIPGGALYETMHLALSKQWDACLSQALYTVALALALAMGIVVVLTVFNVLGILQQHRLKREERSR